MDQRNPYGLPQGRAGMPNGMSPPQRQQQQQQQNMMAPPQHFMSDMLFDPLAMPMGNGMYHPNAGVAPHGGHRGLGGGGGGMGAFHQQGLVPDDDPRFVEDIMMALGGGDPVGVGMGDQSHLGQMPNHVYDQPHIIPPRAQAPPPQRGSLQQPGGMMGQNRMPGRGGQPPNMGAPSSMQMNHMGVGVSMQQQVPTQPTSSMGGVSGLSGLAGPLAPSTVPSAPANNRRQNNSSSVAPSALIPASNSYSKGSNSSALATTNSHAGSSDDEAGMGDDDISKKKERRRQQVRYASRRRRKKQKDEESFLRDRIEELKEQIRIIGGDLTEQCSQMAGMSEQALTEAYEKQMLTVQTLRKDNNKLKEQLLQHENFARMIQYGLNALPSDCRDVDRKKISNVPMWFSDQMNPLKGPTLVVDLNLCHEAVRQAYNELKGFGPSVNSKTNVCYAMGWKTELWATGTCLSFRAVRSIGDKNIREVANASWDIITSPDKCKRIYPDVKQFRVRSWRVDVRGLWLCATDLTTCVFSLDVHRSCKR
jgi:anti-sigma28 factor (negative regulator of flagellin synthesis)